MNFQNEVFWKRCALIAELAHRFSKPSVQFGKTVLQKDIFILQEHYGIDLGYSFELYTYGPFSSEILQDLDLVESLGGVKVESVESGYGGYRIFSGDLSNTLRGNYRDFLESEPVQTALEALKRDFGHFTAKDLELRATIIYIHKDMKGANDYTERVLSDLVQKIKPKFSPGEIQQAIDFLKSKEIVVFT